MKCNGKNVILRGIFHVVSCFPLHFMLYRGNLDYFLDSEQFKSRDTCPLISDMHCRTKYCVSTSVADPERFDADRDPTFQADADRNPFTRVRNFFLQIFIYCFQSLPKLVMCNFSARMREEG